MAFFFSSPEYFLFQVPFQNEKRNKKKKRKRKNNREKKKKKKRGGEKRKKLFSFLFPMCRVIDRLYQRSGFA